MQRPSPNGQNFPFGCSGCVTDVTAGRWPKPTVLFLNGFLLKWVMLITNSTNIILKWATSIINGTKPPTHHADKLEQHLFLKWVINHTHQAGDDNRSLPATPGEWHENL
jgi:hypothetical protein